jgi:hypothetical protein
MKSLQIDAGKDLEYNLPGSDPGSDRHSLRKAVENASYRLGYIILLFGVLFDVSLRGMVRRGAVPDPMSLFTGDWDLLSLVVLSGGVTTAYQGVHRILGHVRVRLSFLAMAAAAAAVFFLDWLRH